MDQYLPQPKAEDEYGLYDDEYDPMKQMNLDDLNTMLGKYDY